MENIVTSVNSKNKTFQIILSAMLISLVFVSTLFLNIRLPIAANGGLVHLGSAMLFIISIIFGPKKERLQGHSGWGYLIWCQAGRFGHHLHLSPGDYRAM